MNKFLKIDFFSEIPLKFADFITNIMTTIPIER